MSKPHKRPFLLALIISIFINPQICHPQNMLKEIPCIKTNYINKIHDLNNKAPLKHKKEQELSSGARLFQNNLMLAKHAQDIFRNYIGNRQVPRSVVNANNLDYSSIKTCYLWNGSEWIISGAYSSGIQTAYGINLTERYVILYAEELGTTDQGRMFNTISPNLALLKKFNSAVDNYQNNR